jgi:hypothetical protein
MNRYGKCYWAYLTINVRDKISASWAFGLVVWFSLRPCLLLWYFHPKMMWGYVGIWCSPNPLKSPQIPFPKNTLPWWRVFNLAKNTLEWRGFVGISRDYPLKTRTSKQPTGKIPGYELIPSHQLKYPRSKQGLRVREVPSSILGMPLILFFWVFRHHNRYSC